MGKRCGALVFVLCLVMLVALSFVPVPAAAEHPTPDGLVSGPSQAVAAAVGQLPGRALGGLMWILTLGTSDDVYNDVNHGVSGGIGYLASIPGLVLEGVYAALDDMINGRGCGYCPLPRDRDRNHLNLP